VRDGVQTLGCDIDQVSYLELTGSLWRVNRFFRAIERCRRFSADKPLVEGLVFHR